MIVSRNGFGCHWRRSLEIYFDCGTS